MSRPPFVDAAYAAEQLGVSPETVLDWISEGKLKVYGGRASNPFIRTVDIAALAEEFGLPKETESPRRVKSSSARVQTRITADARWSDISEEDVREWAQRADGPRRQAARKAASTAVQRLKTVLNVLDELDKTR